MAYRRTALTLLNQGPSGLSFMACREGLTGISMSLPLPLSFEQENELVAKARTKNRLAQRKHRQKMRSFSYGSRARGQEALEIAQRRPRAASTGKDPQCGFDYTNGENLQGSQQTLINVGTDHRYYSANSNTNASRDPSLQAMDLPSMNPGLWASSEAMGDLMSSNSHSTTPSLEFERKISRPFSNGSMNAFDSPFSPVEASRSDTPRGSQTGYSGHGYNYEVASQVPFSSIDTQLSPSLNQESQSSRGNNASCFKPGNEDRMRTRQSSAASYISPSLRSSKLNTPQWVSQSDSTNLDTNPDPGNTFSRLSIDKPIPTPNSNLTPMTASPNPFPNYFSQPAAPMPSIPRADSQRNVEEDEASNLERVLEAIDEAGFDSVDSMTEAYYTSTFPPDSPVHSAQALSKKRHLRRLLAALHESAKSWDAQDAQNFREGIMRSAEDILIVEMQSLDLNSIHGARSNEIFGKLESVFDVKESHEAMKKNKRVFKQQATETWSLLTELGNAMDLRPAQNAQIISAFLSILIGK